MNLDDIKDQLSEKLSSVWGEIQESSTFNTLRERYQTLPSQGQKGLQAAGILFLVLILIYIPYSYFSASSTHIQNFETDRETIQSLLEASRNSQKAPPLPSSGGVAQLTNRIQMVVGGLRLLPEQMGGVQPLSGNVAGGLASPAIKQDAVSVELKTLNITQVMDAGQRLQSLGDGTKLLSMDMTASKSNIGYFDVLFKIVSFSLELPQEEVEAPAPPGRRPLPPRPGQRGN